MKRIVFFNVILSTFLLVTGIFLTVSGEASSPLHSPLTQNEKQWLAEHQVIRLGVDNSWPPFEYIDDQKQYQGMAAEHMRLVEQKLGIRFEIERELDWPQVVEAVKDRRLDAFSCVVKTPAREKFVNFTEPYISFPMVIVTLDTEPIVHRVNSLIGQKVAVVKSYASHDLLVQNHPELDLLLVETVSDGLRDVSNGKAYAFIGNLAVVSHIIREEGVTNLKVSGETPYRFELAMAVRKDWPELVNILQKTLDSISPEEHDQIHKRWIRIQFEEKVDYRFVGSVILTLLSILLVIGYWVWRLRLEISKRQQAEKFLQKNQESLTNAQTIAKIGNWDWEVGAGKLIWSDEIFRIFGFEPGSFSPTYTVFLQSIHPSDRSKVETAIQAALDNPDVAYATEHRIIRPNGEERLVMERGEVKRNRKNTPILMRGIVQDVTELRKAEEGAILAQKVIENVGEAILITDNKGVITAVNPAFEKITGYSRAESIGKKANLTKSGHHPKEFYEEMWKKLLNRGTWEGEIWDRKKSGEIFPKWLSINAITDRDGEVANYVGIFMDISRQKSSEKKLAKMAFYDPLTGLPNRALFQDRLSREISVARRNKTVVAVMFLDLDHFKEVNDTLGHDIGDELLVQVASRINQCLRESDTVSRLGGDEFTLILPGPGTNQDIGKLAAKIITTLQTPFDLKGNEAVVGASIGIAIYPTDGEKSETIIKNADTAMYEAKKNGRGTFHFYS